MRKYLSFVVFALILSSCSQPNPNDDNAHQALDDYLVKNLSGSEYKIITLEKTDGQQIDVGGVKGYRYFYKSTINFPQGYRQECLNSREGLDGFREVVNCASSFGLSKEGIRPEPLNAEVDYEGVVFFERTERAWIVKSISINKVGRETVLQSGNEKLPDAGFPYQTSGGNKINSDSLDSIIKSQNWLDDGGVRLRFSPSGKSDRIKVSYIIERWGNVFEQFSIKSFQIRMIDDSSFVLCYKNGPESREDHEAFMERLRAASPPSSHPATIEHMTIRPGQCGVSELR